MRLVLLTTDTKHHRYFANRLDRSADVHVVLEGRSLDYGRLYLREVKTRGPKALVDNPYLRLPYPLFLHRRSRFEERFFRDGLPREFPREPHRLHDVNEPVCVEHLRSLDPDLIVTFGTLLIREPVLELDPLKVNIHRGIVPDYRGLDSDLWAFYRRDFGNVGTTVHELDPEFDTGPIVDQRRLRIRPGMRVHQIRYHTTVLAADMVEGVVKQLARGDTPGSEPQDPDAGEYFSYIPPIKRMIAVRRFHRHVRELEARDD